MKKQLLNKKFYNTPDDVIQVKDYNSWMKANKEKHNAKGKRYHERLRAATPKNQSAEEKAAINKLYATAKLLTKTLGIQFTVDHIQPLYKSGAHTLDNLRIVTKKENCRKGTKDVSEIKDRFLTAEEAIKLVEEKFGIKIGSK